MAFRAPPDPSAVLARVIRVGTINGRLILIVCALLALVSAAGRDVIGAVVGCLAAGAGALELHGANLLRRGEARGVSWLVRGELLLLGLIVAYSSLQLAVFDVALLREQITPAMRTTLEQAGATVDQFLQLAAQVHRVIFVSAIVVTIFYQGWLARYYHRRRGPVAQALADDAAAGE